MSSYKTPRKHWNTPTAPSYHEIALTLDIAEGTVASRLNRARRSLLDLLKPVIDD